MRHLVYVLFLVLALQAEGALTLTDRGSTTASASSTSVTFTPASTVLTGTLGVLVVTSRNTGSGGSTKIFTASSFTDPLGNIWTRQLDAIYTPGTASQGAEVAAYTAPITTQITTSDTVTITVGTATTGRVVSCYEVSGANGSPTVVASAAISDGLTTGQGGNPLSMTTASITSADAVICWVGRQNGTTMTTGDTDTVNGSWSAVLDAGQSTVPMRLSRQYKVVTATGTQTWDVSPNTGAWQSAWIQVREAVLSTTDPGGFMIWAQ